MNLKDFHHPALALSAALWERHTHTYQHCNRVGEWSRNLGREMGLDIDDLELLAVCAQHHDIGKIGIPDRILLKVTRFTEEEWNRMKTHSEIGERIILATEVPQCEKAARIIRHHHENYAGDGYPDGLWGESIPLLSRMIFVVDAYDAIRNTRGYRPARSHADAMKSLESEAGRKFDAGVVQAFKRCIEQYSYPVEP